MPGFLDSGKGFLADAMTNLISGKIQAASLDMKSAIQIITHFQPSMQANLNSENRNNMMIPHQ